MVRLVSVTTLIVALLAGCASLEDQGVVTGVEIVEYGILEKDENDKWLVVKATDQIPPVDGTRFGIRFRIIGEPQGAMVNMRVARIIGSRTTAIPHSYSYVGNDRYALGETYVAIGWVGSGITRLPGKFSIMLGKKGGPIYVHKDFWVVKADDK